MSQVASLNSINTQLNSFLCYQRPCTRFEVSWPLRSRTTPPSFSNRWANSCSWRCYYSHFWDYSIVVTKESWCALPRLLVYSCNVKPAREEATFWTHLSKGGTNCLILGFLWNLVASFRVSTFPRVSGKLESLSTVARKLLLFLLEPNKLTYVRGTRCPSEILVP